MQPEIKISAQKVLERAGARAGAGCEVSLASLGLPPGCSDCKVEARGGDYFFTPPEKLPEPPEFTLPFTARAACGGGATAADAGGSLTITLLPDNWDGPWCPQAWPELKGVGVALSIAFTQTAAADCTSAPFAGSAGNAPAAFAGLVADALKRSVKQRQGARPLKVVAKKTGVCKASAGPRAL